MVICSSTVNNHIKMEKHKIPERKASTTAKKKAKKHSAQITTKIIKSLKSTISCAKRIHLHPSHHNIRQRKRTFPVKPIKYWALITTLKMWLISSQRRMQKPPFLKSHLRI